MPEQLSARQQRLAREKAVYQYITALEQGDIDTIAALLQQAEHDPTLEQMIMEAHEEYAREDQNAPQPGQIAAIRYKLLNVLSEQEEAGILASRPPARTRRRRIFIQSAVAVVVICALIGSALLLFAPRQPHTSSPKPQPVLGTWNLVTSPNPGAEQNYLYAVSADAANDAWAVGSFSDIPYLGESEKALIEHWNGFAWSVVKSHNAQLENSGLDGIVALSPDNVWAVGYSSPHNGSNSQPLIEHWNGNLWSIVNSPVPPANSSLNAIAAASANDIWAVGSYSASISSVSVQRALIEHWDGRSWKIVPGPNVGKGLNYLTGIAALSSSDVWAVGFYSSNNVVLGSQSALIEHWNGTVWTVVSSPYAGAESFLNGITALSPDDIWAVGFFVGNSAQSSPQEGLVEHWNGSSWSVVASPDSAIGGSSLNAVAVLSVDDVWAVGSAENANAGVQGQTLIEHWNGHSWSVVDSPNAGAYSNFLRGIASTAHSTEIWAVGNIEHDIATASPAPATNQQGTGISVNSQTIIESYGG